MVLYYPHPKDKYIKYPLPIIDKSKIKFNLGYMRDGGNQLIEILEKAFSLDYIQDHQRALHITNSQLDYLDSWLRHNTVVGQVAREYGIESLTAKNFFYKGKGLLGKLYKHLDISPTFNDDGEINESPFTFIDYEVMAGDHDTILVTSKVNMQYWSAPKYNLSHKLMEQHFCYQKIDNKYTLIDNDSTQGRDLIFASEILDLLSGDQNG